MAAHNRLVKPWIHTPVSSHAMVLPWVVQEAYFGPRSHFENTKEKALISWSLSLCFLPFSLFIPKIFSVSTACILEPLASVSVKMLTLPLTPDGN